MVEPPVYEPEPGLAAEPQPEREPTDVLVLHLILVSHLQPYARYAYRAAAFAITNASFQTLLRPGQFS